MVSARASKKEQPLFVIFSQLFGKLTSFQKNGILKSSFLLGKFNINPGGELLRRLSDELQRELS